MTIKVSGGTASLTGSLGTGMFNDVGDYNGDGTPDVITFGAPATGTGVGAEPRT